MATGLQGTNARLQSLPVLQATSLATTPTVGIHHVTPFGTLPRFLRKQARGVRGSRPQSISVAAATANNSLTEDTPHLQLATAKLPVGVDVQAFVSNLFNWASSLTSSGRNMPFALPLRITRLQNGFQTSLLRVDGDQLLSVGDVVASVEEVPNTGNVLFVRFFGGEANVGGGTPRATDPDSMLRQKLAGLVDVPLIMQTLPDAIKAAVRASVQAPKE